MSWLNFNDSLTSIKGQLTNLASGVLTEGIIPSKDEGDVSIKPQVDGTKTNNSQVEKNDNAWFWKPTEENSISVLEQKIEELEKEKKELIVSLEQLDYDCQQTTDKLVTLKDNLRADYDELKTKYDQLCKGQHDTSNLTNKICILNSQNEKLQASYETLKEEHLKLKNQLEESENESVEVVNQKLVESQKVREDVQESHAQQHVGLASEISLKLENERLLIAHETLQEENTKLKLQIEEVEANSKLQLNERLKVDHRIRDDLQAMGIEVGVGVISPYHNIAMKSTKNEELVISQKSLQEENAQLKLQLEENGKKLNEREKLKLVESQKIRDDVEESHAQQHVGLASEISLKLENERLLIAHETLQEENTKLKLQIEEVEANSKLQLNERLKVDHRIRDDLQAMGIEVGVGVISPYHNIAMKSTKNEELVISQKSLQEENAQLKLQLEENGKKLNESEILKVENQKLVEELQKLRLEVEKHSIESSQNEKMFNSHKNLEEENTKLKFQLEENAKKLQESEKLKVENQKFAEELQKLRLEVGKNSLESSQNEKLTISHKILQEENTKLKFHFEENVKSLHDNEKLKVENQKLEEELQKLRLEVEKNFVASSQNEELVSSYENLKKEHANLVAQQKELEAQQKLKFIDEKSENQLMAQELQTLREELIKQSTLHETYMKILTGNMKKYLNTDLEEDSWTPPNEDVKAREFSDKLESLLKFVVELKSKIEILENELYQVKQDKNSAVMEKNFEIEKLLQNSEVLSQEVIAKSRTIKDYEEECNELMKNNEALITELQSYKSNCGLQTISEGNEDNLLLLESQLENANKRIQDLELVVSDFDNSKQETSLEIETELNYIKKQLNLTGQELNKSKEEYRELLILYNESQQDTATLKLALDKMKLDYENIEYKLTETNVNLESLQEENDISKLRAEKLENRKEDLINDVDVLQNLVDDLKQKLSIQEGNDKEKDLHVRNLVEKLQNAKMCETSLKLQIDTMSKELQLAIDAKQTSEVNYQQILSKLQEVEGKTIASSDENYSSLQEKLEIVTKEKHALEINYGNLEKSAVELQLKVNFLESQLKEIVTFVTTKDEENVKYYNEIQRLNQLLAIETEKNSSNSIGDVVALNEKITNLSDKNEFLSDKCDVLAKSLLDEQKNVQKALAEKQPIIEREQALSKELERLRIHLVDIEETYTKDLLESEERNKEMQTKLNEIVRREKDSSSIYTSVSIRANQQVETLQTQLQLVTNQRDDLRIKISNYEDLHNKQIAALTNLQLVLDQFQKDKEKDVGDETERIRRQINIEKGIQKELRDEIAVLKSQLEESKQGLQAASRLADQLEKCKQQILAFKELEKNMQEQIRQSEATNKELSTQTDSKVDKTLIKNLMLGYMGSNSGDTNQILKIIATVLDFNQQECDKVNLNKQQGGWLSSILNPQALSSNSDISQESLSQAFVKFLENESKPKVVPNLLSSNPTRKLSTDSSKSSTRQSPLLLSEVVLPTFADFGRSRNSGSILKDVLKDNS